VYDELSDRFATFVEVLGEVRRNTHFASGGGNLLRLYEEWLKTGSEWLERRLRGSGILAIEGLAPRRGPN
jgi:hypothetical protein